MTYHVLPIFRVLTVQIVILHLLPVQPAESSLWSEEMHGYPCESPTANIAFAIQRHLSELSGNPESASLLSQPCHRQQYCSTTTALRVQQK